MRISCPGSAASRIAVNRGRCRNTEVSRGTAYLPGGTADRAECVPKATTSADDTTTVEPLPVPSVHYFTLIGEQKSPFPRPRTPTVITDRLAPTRPAWRHRRGSPRSPLPSGPCPTPSPPAPLRLPTPAV